MQNLFILIFTHSRTFKKYLHSNKGTFSLSFTPSSGTWGCSLSEHISNSVTHPCSKADWLQKFQLSQGIKPRKEPGHGCFMGSWTLHVASAMSDLIFNAIHLVCFSKRTNGCHHRLKLKY